MTNKWWMGDKPDSKKESKHKAKTKAVVDKKPEKTNDIKDLVNPDTIDEVVGQIASISSDKKDERRDKFLLYWLLGYSVKVAGLTAGYKESYAKFGLYEVLKLPIVKERLLQITSAMPEKYKALCRMRLGDVAEVEGGVIKLMKDDPEMAMKHPQMLKQMKQAAGVLADETIPAPTVHVKTLKIIQNVNLAACESRLAAIEAEKKNVIDVTPSQDKQ